MDIQNNQDPDNDLPDDDMPRTSKDTLMSTALTKTQPQPWRQSDGDRQPAKQSADHNVWKVVELSEPACIINLTDPTKSDISNIIHFKALTPTDPSKYDWDFILLDVTEILIICKPAIIQSVAQLNKNTITHTFNKGKTTITIYLYQPDLLKQTTSSPTDKTNVGAPNLQIVSAPTVSTSDTGAVINPTDKTNVGAPSSQIVSAPPVDTLDINMAGTSDANAVINETDKTFGDGHASRLFPATPHMSHPISASPSFNMTGLFSSRPPNPTMSFGANLRDIKWRRMGTDN
ncbi:hypothetical protein CFD26_108769 [Aspergillus turcosus]|uniref:Uncharacterized protein n=1 Tax=Aspergillus turcosus TaxID=1245748 RepID=A0A3R7GFA7_9EURO|nr:hypothetical protein CFD26_108769 [Aspergillus turcosus]